MYIHVDLEVLASVKRYLMKILLANDCYRSSFYMLNRSELVLCTCSRMDRQTLL